VPETDNSAPTSRTRNNDVSLNDIIETLKAYVRQELVGPLTGVGRWIAFGIAGALALGLGFLYVLLGVLRLVQTEWQRSASGSLSWLAYLITLAATLALLALTLSRVKKSTLGNEPSSKN
jgi:hypothetical protein